MPGYRDRRDKSKDRLADVPFGKHGSPRRFTLCIQPADSAYLKDRTDYTYRFRFARPQKDPVIRQIRDGIIKLKQDPDHGILMCNHNIQVFPSTESPVIWPLIFTHGADGTDVKFYTFCQDPQEFPATVPVSIISREGPLSANVIHVRVGGKWVPVKEWLVQLADSSILGKRNTSPITFFWHKRNGKTFRLMDLPVELQLMIFERVIAPSDEVYPLNKAFLSTLDWAATTQTTQENLYITLGCGYSKEDMLSGCYGAVGSFALECREPIPPPNLNLMYVSK
jgi:hypothetical protein